MSTRELGPGLAGDLGPATPATGRRLRLAGLALLAVALLGGAAWTWHWWTHPEVFAEGGASFTLRRDLETVRPLHVAMTHPDVERGGERQVVRITGADPVVLENSAEATIELRICTPRPGDVLGAAHGRIERYCSDLRPAVGRDLELRGVDSEYVVMTVSPTRRGVVEVDRMRLEYTVGMDGWPRRGTDRVGYQIRMAVR